MARYDDLNTGSIAYVTFVSSVLLLLIILLSRALCYSWIEAEDNKKLSEAHYTAADAKISEQKSRIAKYDKLKVQVVPAAGEAEAGAVAEEQERLVIPVDRARDLLLQDWKTEPNA